MNVKLTARQRRFTAEYLKDANGAQAAIRAGYSRNGADATAARLLAKPHVRAAVNAGQHMVATAAAVTTESLLDECEEARAVAKKAKQAGAMVAASHLKAKLTGRLIDKVEDAVARDRLELERKQLGELKTAATLLAEAATSLGLPPAATPAQIMGALADRQIATPEAFRLLRIGQISEGTPT